MNNIGVVLLLGILLVLALIGLAVFLLGPKVAGAKQAAKVQTTASIFADLLADADDTPLSKAWLDYLRVHPEHFSEENRSIFKEGFRYAVRESFLATKNDGDKNA